MEQKGKPEFENDFISSNRNGTVCCNLNCYFSNDLISDNLNGTK
jgi:hypothetical protein